MNTIEAGVLLVGYLDDGAPDGWPVVLSHGFPYDVHAYDEVVPWLTSQGARVIRPYQRGFGPTRFRSPETRRSGQQAALGSDLVSLIGALGLQTTIVAGYDWGGLASCVVSVLWPERIAGLVSLASYDIIDIEGQQRAFPPAAEHAVWYQHLFQTERGRQSLAEYRRELCQMLWQQWSPGWQFDEAFEQRLAGRPPITVPAVTLDGRCDPLKPGGTADQAAKFTSRHEHRTIEAGHNLPQEAPEAFADAVLTVRGWL